MGLCLPKGPPSKLVNVFPRSLATRQATSCDNNSVQEREHGPEDLQPGHLCLTVTCDWRDLHRGYLSIVVCKMYKLAMNFVVVCSLFYAMRYSARVHWSSLVAACALVPEFHVAVMYLVVNLLICTKLFSKLSSICHVCLTGTALALENQLRPKPSHRLPQPRHLMRAAETRKAQLTWWYEHMLSGHVSNALPSSPNQCYCQIGNDYGAPVPNVHAFQDILSTCAWSIRKQNAAYYKCLRESAIELLKYFCSVINYSPHMIHSWICLLNLGGSRNKGETTATCTGWGSADAQSSWRERLPAR